MRMLCRLLPASYTRVGLRAAGTPRYTGRLRAKAVFGTAGTACTIFLSWPIPCS
jgi:hypothetical protein